MAFHDVAEVRLLGVCINLRDVVRSVRALQAHKTPGRSCFCAKSVTKLTWLVLGEDPAARSHRVEQFTAL